MKTEDKLGGPTDPLYGFEECCQNLYDQDPARKHLAQNCTLHPLHEYVARFSHRVTPTGGAVDAPALESGTKTQKDVNRELSMLVE